MESSEGEFESASEGEEEAFPHKPPAPPLHTSKIKAPDVQVTRTPKEEEPILRDLDFTQQRTKEKDEPKALGVQVTNASKEDPILRDSDLSHQKTEEKDEPQDEEKAIQDDSRIEKRDTEAESREGEDGWDDWDEKEDTVESEVERQTSIPKPQTLPLTEVTDVVEGAGEWGDWDSMLTPATAADPRAPKLQLRSPAAESNHPSPQTHTPQAGGWGWSSLVSAASGVVNSAMESVESVVGAPSPDDLANAPTPDRPQPPPELERADGGGIGGLFSGVSNVFGNTSKTLVAGSIDALETLGKKTFDVLTVDSEDGKRRRLRGIGEEKPSLSSVLRELQGKEDGAPPAPNAEPALPQFPALFDQAQGLMNLEALEMVSRRCGEDVEAVPGRRVAERRAALAELAAIFAEGSPHASLSEEEGRGDFPDRLSAILASIRLPYSPDKLSGTHAASLQSLEALRSRQGWPVVEEKARLQEAVEEAVEGVEVLEAGLRCLATLTSAGLESFLKLAQLSLVPGTTHSLQPSAFKELEQLLCDEVQRFSSSYSDCLNTAADDAEDPDSISPLITTLFLEVLKNIHGYR